MTQIYMQRRVQLYNRYMLSCHFCNKQCGAVLVELCGWMDLLCVICCGGMSGNVAKAVKDCRSDMGAKACELVA
jgi:hypothetical protein